MINQNTFKQFKSNKQDIYMIGIFIFDIILSIYQHPDCFHNDENFNGGNKKENVFSQMFKKIYSNFKQKNQKEN